MLYEKKKHDAVSGIKDAMGTIAMGILPDRVTIFTVITGPRGACKTLYMTPLVVDKLIKSQIRKLLHLPENRFGRMIR